MKHDKKKGCCKASKGLALSSLKGFTLIELLVVIAIIGILATIVLVSLNSARVKARDTRRLSDMQQMSLAMEMYYDGNSSAYPTGDFAACVAALKTAKLIGATPIDPSSPTKNYAALTGGTASSYCFYVTLEGTTTQYAVTSEHGAGKRSSAPTIGDCGPNL